MGLTIRVGTLAEAIASKSQEATVRHWLERANRALARAGAGQHVEPEVLPSPLWESARFDIPYSTIHYVRRVQAHWVDDGHGFRAKPFRGDPSLDPQVARVAAKGIEDRVFPDLWASYQALYQAEQRGEPLPALSRRRPSHLCRHSDSDGLYVPLALDDVIRDPEVPGEFLGSSVSLLAEIREIAPALGITLVDGGLTPADALALRDDDDSAPLFHERLGWLALFENARLSVAHGTAIVFS